MAIQPINYWQTDPRWKNISYSTKGESTTIGASGCGPTSAAMILATWADKNVTPKTECAWALKNGYKAYKSGTYYSYFVPAFKRYGLKCTWLSSTNIYGNSTSPLHAQAKAAVDRGDLVIACMGKGTWTSSGHYIVVWKISGNTVYINDPASTKLARTQGDYSIFKKQVKYYWVITNPGTAPKTEDIKTTDYYVKINSDDGFLNIRNGAGTNYNKVGKYTNGEVVHITKISASNWGYTGAGWIHLNYTVKVNAPTKQEEDEDMTLEKFTELMDQYLMQQAKKPADWEKEDMAWAKSKGLMKGSNENSDNLMPKKFVTRGEVAALFHRYDESK